MGKASEKPQTIYRGVSGLSLLGLVFVVAKLWDVVDWSCRLKA